MSSRLSFSLAPEGLAGIQAGLLRRSSVHAREHGALCSDLLLDLGVHLRLRLQETHELLPTLFDLLRLETVGTGELVPLSMRLPSLPIGTRAGRVRRVTALPPRALAHQAAPRSVAANVTATQAEHIGTSTLPTDGLSKVKRVSTCPVQTPPIPG